MLFGKCILGHDTYWQPRIKASRNDTHLLALPCECHQHYNTVRNISNLNINQTGKGSKLRGDFDANRTIVNIYRLGGQLDS